jgi:ABC-2 type transport system ATP-binding protein
MVTLENIHFSFKDREVLKGVSFAVAKKEIFGLLGPNGSGKTTLFRILSTRLRAASGQVVIAGDNLPKEQNKARTKMGVVFQSPSLDGKLTVAENLKHHGHLHGLTGGDLKRRIDEMMEKLGIRERSKELVEKLSGGLKRRVELAKSLLHDPSLLILDEPSTGLDPGARIDLWKYLKNLRDEKGMTILVTTHLMDEAEHCDRVAIMRRGQIVKIGNPTELKRRISGDIILIKAQNPEVLSASIRQKFGVNATVIDHMLQVEHDQGPEFIAKLAGAFSSEIESITFRKPTLEDVFVHETGHRFWDEEAAHE